MVHTRKGPIAIVLAAVVAVAVLVGCTGAGLPGPGDPNGNPFGEDGIEFATLPPEALYGIILSPDDAAPEGANEAAVELASGGFAGIVIAQLYVVLAYSGWDPALPETYVSGGVTFTWSKNGNTYTWTYSYNDGIEQTQIVVEVTDKDASLDVAVTVDGDELLAGTVADGGMSGTARWYQDPTDPTNSFGVVWGPAAAPYDVAFTVSRYEGETVTDGLVVKTTAAGTTGEWAYYAASPFVTAVAGNTWPTE